MRYSTSSVFREKNNLIHGPATFATFPGSNTARISYLSDLGMVLNVRMWSWNIYNTKLTKNKSRVHQHHFTTKIIKIHPIWPQNGPFQNKFRLENTKDFHSPHTKYMFSLMFAAAGLHDRICYGIHDMRVILKWMVLWCYWMDLVDFCCKIKLVNSTFVFNEFGVVNVSCSHSYIENHTKIR